MQVIPVVTIIIVIITQIGRRIRCALIVIKRDISRVILNVLKSKKEDSKVEKPRQMIHNLDRIHQQASESLHLSQDNLKRKL